MTGVVNNDTDDLLISRTLKGEKDSFEILVVRYQKRIFNIIYRVIREEAAVPDLAQDVFLKAYRGLGKFDFRSSFYTWLVRIAINTSLNHVSSRGRAPITTGEDIDLTVGKYDASDYPERPPANPEQEVMRGEQSRTIQVAINSLPEDLRLAITLREIEGLSYEEIAEVMGCPIGTVRSRIHRARSELKEKLQSIL